ncbi:MAG: hypothetical protein CFH01_01532, partial [Alphaproteobacteria bacterium MarineAlpha2_Bin1]
KLKKIVDSELNKFYELTQIAENFVPIDFQTHATSLLYKLK